MKDLGAIASVVEGIRGSNGLNRPEMAVIMGVSKSTYYERLDSDNWTIGELRALAHYIGRSIDIAIEPTNRRKKRGTK